MPVNHATAWWLHSQQLKKTASSTAHRLALRDMQAANSAAPAATVADRYLPLCRVLGPMHCCILFEAASFSRPHCLRSSSSVLKGHRHPLHSIVHHCRLRSMLIRLSQSRYLFFFALAEAKSLGCSGFHLLADLCHRLAGESLFIFLGCDDLLGEFPQRFHVLTGIDFTKGSLKVESLLDRQMVINHGLKERNLPFRQG